MGFLMAGQTLVRNFHMQARLIGTLRPGRLVIEARALIVSPPQAKLSTIPLSAQAPCFTLVRSSAQRSLDRISMVDKCEERVCMGTSLNLSATGEHGKLQSWALG